MRSSGLGLEELDPFVSSSLCGRFPHLKVAVDADLMRDNLQRLLFDGTELVAEACARPRARVADGICRLQYPLRIRAASGESHEALVFGTMFADAGKAAKFERVHLAPLAAAQEASEGPAPKPSGVLGSLGMATGLFPVCDQLPTLVEVTDPQRMIEMFQSIPDFRNEVEVVGIDLVRVTRTPRCVLRYRLAAVDGSAVVYGKVASIPARDDVLAGLDALARRARREPHAAVFVPRVLGHSRELDLMLFAVVSGTRPDLRVEAALGPVIDAAASAAASMHVSGIRSGQARTFDDELAWARNQMDLIRLDAPALVAWLTMVVDAVAAVARRTPRQPLAFAHGDFTPSQLLLAESRVGVLDFDDLCQAEPALDLGRFLAYVQVGLAKSAMAAHDSLASRLLATYHAVGGPPTEEARVELYGVVSLILMAVHSWQRLKSERLQVVCAVLEHQLARLI